MKIKNVWYISLNRNTVVEKITDLACNLNYQITIKSRFFILYDKSSDINDVAIINDISTENDVFICFFDLLKKYNILLSNVFSMVKKMASFMAEINKSFIEQLQKNS